MSGVVVVIFILGGYIWGGYSKRLKFFYHYFLLFCQ